MSPGAEPTDRIVDVVDLVADQYDCDPEDALVAALGRVRKRGGFDE